MNLMPRKYLSFSQMVLFQRNKELYKEVYFFNKKLPTSRPMAFGSQMAGALEDDKLTGNATLDLMMVKLPKFSIMDKEFLTEFKHGKETIKILAKPDTMKKDCSAFKEYKTSMRKWTQKMADDSDQITFYATAMWLRTKKIPQDIELVVIGTKAQLDGKIAVTGDIWRYPTKRNMSDILGMMSRMIKCWHGIKQLSEETLL